jgi:polyvinyl alcohol dehydrogenase (cytochrome)
MTSRRPRLARLAVAAIAGATALTAGAAAASAGTSWPTYHGDLSRSGVDASEASLSPIKAAWSAPLDGAEVYGQPVVAQGRVFVATENDDVYSLDAHDGHVLWSANIGAPLQNVNNYSCGDVDPLGITSTPAVDPATNTLFVVGEVSTNGAPPVKRIMVGFDLFTGQRTVTALADPTGGGDTPVNLLQRAALAIANGRVYVAFGGQFGDCGSYHGWVVGVDEHDARPNVEFDVTPGSQGGAIWNGGGGPSVDSAGNVYVTTGNQNGSSTIPPYAEAVVKLTPALSVLAHFQDQAASGDADLATGDALLLPNGDLFTVGKTDIGYLLRQSDLTQVHAISGTVCGSDPDGGATYDAADNSVYVPCRGAGIQQVNLTTNSTGWRAGSADGSPILVGGALWSAHYGSNLIQELNPATGAVEQQITTTSNMPTFTTPAAADGLLLVGTDHGVQAFDGPSGPPPPATAAPAPTAGYRLVASDGGVFSFGTARFYGSLGGVRLAAPIVGAVPTVDRKGYWLVASDGGVFSFGDAKFYGSTGGTRLAQPVVGMAAAPDGKGYWLVARDGGVFAFGPGARFEGSTGGTHLNAPVVAMAADVATAGYWLFAADGGVFSFGAPFYGSTGGIRLVRPVVGAAAATSGHGYLMAASDGGIFNYGPAAVFHGSTGGVALSAPIVGLAVDARTGGYWLTGADGGVFTFDAPFEGSTGGVALTRPVVAISAG